ncbi:MAG: YraN family protein [Oscillospiraceae bacterium]
MSRYKKDLGDFGEEMAEKYFEKHGYKIVERNYRIREGEIDIILKNDKALVFVEVKTRKSDKYGFPAEAVTFSKKKKLIKTAEHYLYNTPTELEIRFDVVEVYAEIRKGEFVFKDIHHIKNAILEVNL